MLSTLFPPDPTLTVENVGQVMEKVEPNVKMKVWESIVYYDHIIEEIQEKYSTDSEKETAYVNMYVNCDKDASWEEIAENLYQHHQLAAVDEVRSYLPPRGEPCFWSACIYYTGSFNSHTEILRKGLNFGVSPLFDCICGCIS